MLHDVSMTLWCRVAIIRPGPIAGKMMHPYMRRRQGKEAVTLSASIA